MKTTLFICFVITALSLSSCNNDDDANNADTFEPTPITPTLIAEGNIGENETLAEQKLVLTDESDWLTLKTQMEPYSTSFDDSNLNFSESMVLAVFTPVELNNVSIAIDSTIEHQDKIKVFVGEPVEGISPTLSVGYSIVKIPSSEKPVVFE